MAMIGSNRAEQLRTEKALLLKAETDIANGSKRVLVQEDLLRQLEAAGHDTREARRLLGLYKQTLTAWERHRVLIEQRVAYLEGWPMRDG